jgi:hypothetical protein
MNINQRLFRRFFYLIPILPAAAILFSFTTDPSILETILKKLRQYHTERPQEKLYLHLDKPFYAAGENIWFKAYLVEASLHRLDSQSRVVYVDLIDDNHTVFKQQMLYAPGGVTFGDFQLPDTLKEGKYAIRAYTNYMKNSGEDFFFVKEFSVLNPLRNHLNKSPAKFAADSLELQFFPEGGNFVACGFNRLGFKALGPDGKGINVEGTIMDDNNTVVASFKSQHAGMGMVRINPVAGRKYFARIIKPYTVNRRYPLPVVRETGYTLQVDAVNTHIKVLVFTNTHKPASGDQTVNIVVQSRGLAYHAQQGVITNNAFFTLIPQSKFPDGISQITVFDAEGRPVAERLVHHNHNETVKLRVETDTAIYGKRKMVAVLMDAMYRNGSPAAGHFSISVYDEGLIQNQEEYPLSIVNYLSLTSDLKGYIEDPGYYFKDSLQETKRNLDLLMMIHGWRRFTWNDVLSDTLPPPAYRHEQGIPVSGKVLKAGGKQPPAGSIVKVLTMNGNAVRLRPDSLGRFYTDSLLYYDSMTLVFQTENQKGKKQPYKFSLDPISMPPPVTHSFTSFLPFNASAFLQQSSDEKLIEKSSQVKVLDEARVTAKRDEPDPRLIGGTLDKRTVFDVNKNGGGMGYANIFQMIQTRFSGVIVSGNTIKIRGKDAGYVVNGILTPPDAILMIAPTDIDFIEVIHNSVRHGGQHIINIILKNGSIINDIEPVGINQAKIAGFYQAREFYSPNYDVKDDRHNLEDKRTTLYWEPMIITDENGRAAVAFFTADVASRYRVVVEGITPDGYPGTGTTTFEVK